MLPSYWELGHYVLCKYIYLQTSYLKYPWLYFRKVIKNFRNNRMANFCNCVCSKIHSGIKSLSGLCLQSNQWTGLKEARPLCGMGIWWQQAVFLKSSASVTNTSSSFLFPHSVKYIFSVRSAKPWQAVQPQTIKRMSGRDIYFLSSDSLSKLPTRASKGYFQIYASDCHF